jgi:hypothetical protein
VAPSCTDGIKNQGESDVDCGGTTTCPRCPDYKTCTAPTDCATAACTTGYCGTTGCLPFGTAGGYTGCARTVAVASLPCEDIRTTGTRSAVGDDSYTTVTLPFSFNFFSTPRTSILLSASGGVGFTTGYPSYNNYCLPTTSVPYPFIAALWDHLHPGGSVYYQTIGAAPNRRFVIQWDSPIYSNTTPRIDVRMVMKEGKGDIDVCYVATAAGGVGYDSGSGATAGIQNGSGLAIQYSCNTSSLLPGLLLTYTAP